MVRLGISQGSCRAALRQIVPVLALIVLSGCVEPGGPGQKTGQANAGHGAAKALPPMRWDHRPEAARWTAAALAAVALRDDRLALRVPNDIAEWCPGYETASLDDRRAFWVGLLSALAKHESSWNPQAAGGKGRWIGLMQISPKTARSYGCSAQSVAALKDGSANLACAVQIFSGHVARDGVVAGSGKRGIGRDWVPFRKASKRGDMAAWTRAQPYCAKG